MDKNYKINPCKACKKNYDIKDINNINQCCVDTLAAFEGANSINSFRSRPEAENCKCCIEESKKAMGRDLCEFRLPLYPTWIQAPHFFPTFLVQEGNVEQAKKLCIDACEGTRYENECIKNCNIDSQAVDGIENVVKENYILNEKQHSQQRNIFQKVIEGNECVCVLAVLIFLGVLGLFIYNCFKNKPKISKV